MARRQSNVASFLLLVLVASSVSATAQALTRTSIVDVSITAASLNSGVTLDACEDVNGSSCWGGMMQTWAITRYLHRRAAATGGVLDPVASRPAESDAIAASAGATAYFAVFIPFADIYSAFANVHPLSHGVNVLVFDQLQLPLFLPTYTSMLSDDITLRPGQGLLANGGASQLLLSNSRIPTGSRFFGRTQRTWYAAPNVVVLHVGEEHGGAYAEGAKESLAGILTMLQLDHPRAAAALVTVVVTQKLPYATVLEFASIPNPPNVVWCIDPVYLGAIPSEWGTPQTLVNRTTFIVGEVNADFVTTLRLTLDERLAANESTTTSPSSAAQTASKLTTGIANFSVDTNVLADGAMAPVKEKSAATVSLRSAKITRTTIYDVPSDAKDAMYYRHEAFFLMLTRQARANDPIIGQSATEMPASKLPDGQRLCFIQETPMSNLFVDAMIWRTGAQLGYINACGANGPAWPAGPVSLSTIFERFPWPDSLCTGRFLGLHIWEFIAGAFDTANLNPEGSDSADSFLQVSRLRLKFNPNANASRILAIDVWSNETRTYEPLERLKYYTFVTSDYVCVAHSKLFIDLMKPKYRGEFVVPRSSDALQDLVGQFMTSIGPMQHNTEGRILSLAGIPPMLWAQSASTCATNQRFDSELGTCFDMPKGPAISTELLSVIVSASAFLVLISTLSFRVMCTGRGLGALLAAGMWTPIGSAALRIADIAASVASCYTIVVNPLASLEFKGVYLGLIAIAFIICTIDVVAIIRYLLILVEAAGDVAPEVDKVWRVRLQQLVVLGVVGINIPMIVLSSVAMAAAPSALPLIALAFACFMFGFKTSRLKEVARMILENMRARGNDDEPSSADDGALRSDAPPLLIVPPPSVGELHSAQRSSSGDGDDAQRKLSNVSCGSAGLNPLHGPPSLAAFVPIAVPLPATTTTMNRARREALRRFGVDIVSQAVLDRITDAEFQQVIIPILAKRFPCVTASSTSAAAAGMGTASVLMHASQLVALREGPRGPRSPTPSAPQHPLTAAAGDELRNLGGFDPMPILPASQAVLPTVQPSWPTIRLPDGTMPPSPHVFGPPPLASLSEQQNASVSRPAAAARAPPTDSLNILATMSVTAPPQRMSDPFQANNVAPQGPQDGAPPPADVPDNVAEAASETAMPAQTSVDGTKRKKKKNVKAKRVDEPPGNASVDATSPAVEM